MADSNTDTKAPKADAPAAEAHKPAAAPAPAAKAAEAPKADAPKAEAPKAAAPKAEAPKAAAQKAEAPKAAKPARKPARAKAAAKPAARTAKPARAAKQAQAKQVQAAKASVRTTSKIADKGTQTMKNETKKATETVQNVLGEVNARAKTAFERNTRFAEELTELSRGNVEALVASTKVAAKGFETIGQEVAEFGRKSFEDASSALKSFADVKTPADLFRLQTEFVRSQFDAVVAESSKLSEVAIKLAGDIAQPLTNRATVAAERVREVATV
jgi:phasin family protein